MKRPGAGADADAADSNKCCSAILRRLLCSGGLPTHPSESDDHFILREIQKLPNFIKPDVAAANGKQNVSSPGVVARLMGLDSFPNAPLVRKDTSLAALLRSRSVNSIDFLLPFDPAATKGQLQHRRVRTSVSFREGENDECISAVLRLEKVEGTETRKKVDQKGGKEWKPTREKGEIFQEKRAVGKKPGKRMEMEEKKRPCFDEHVTVTPQKKDFQGTRTRVVVKPVKNSKEELKDSKCVKKRKNKVLAHKPDSNLNLKKIYPEGSVTAAGVHSRKPLLPENGFSQRSCSARPQDSGKGEVTAIIERKIEKKMKGSEEKCYSTRIVEEICRATEEHVKENWECGMTSGFGDFEEICQMFGQEILHVLLMQLVDELVRFYGTREASLVCI